MKTAEEWEAEFERLRSIGERPYPDEFARMIQADALAPFLALLRPAVEDSEAWRAGESLPADDARAVEIYSWALGLTWGEIRRALAVIPRPADDSSASRA